MDVLKLAWANLMHHQLRTALSALAVGIGIALMLVSKGLANGSIAEVHQRVQSVNAELVVLPAQENIIFTSGAPFPGIFERFLARQADARGPLATTIIPVFFGQVRMAGQQQRVFGVDPRQMELFLDLRRVLEGKLFDRAYRLSARIDGGVRASRPRTGGGEWASRPQIGERLPPQPRAAEPHELAPDELDDGLELVIDERLRRVGWFDPAAGRQRPYQLGDEIKLMGKSFRIVGVVEAGVAGRVFAPIQTLRELLNGGEPWSSMFFVKLRRAVDPTAAADQLQAALGDEARVELKTEYGRLLHESFAQVSTYMDVSSGLALVVSFIIILLTMYTMVVERTREIGILKSLGVTRLGLLGLSVLEALMVSVAGVSLGIALAFAAKWALGLLRPLLTCELAHELLLAAVLFGVVGGVVSALYPGYRAARLEPAAALSYE